MCFTITEAAPHERAGAWSIAGVENINIKCNGKSCGSLPRNLNRVIHTSGQATFIDLAHGEKPHSQPANKIALARIQVTRADVRTYLRIELWCKAPDVYEFGCTIAQQRRQGHAMNVTRRCGVRRVHVCVSIKIDKTQSLIALAKSLD